MRRGTLARLGLILALSLAGAAPVLAQGNPPQVPPAAPALPAAAGQALMPPVAPTNPNAPGSPAPPAATPVIAPPGVVLPAAPSSPASPDMAAPTRPAFDCVGAEQLEDDAFAIPFARGAGTLAPAADGALEALLARTRAEPSRPICILGHAGPQEGGATANTRLAARRAAAVAEELARRGLPRERLRAEIRVAAFARAAAIPAGRSVTAVLLPAP